MFIYLMNPKKGGIVSQKEAGTAVEQDPVEDKDEIHRLVRTRYAEFARAAADRPSTESGCGCGCGPEGEAPSDCGTSDQAVFGGSLYGADQSEAAPAAAVEASLGCGVPTAVADLAEGETVLDLGSGAGADVLISAKRVGSSGRVIGLDMTDEMLDLARRNAEEAGAENVEFLKGMIEEIPLPDSSVDVVISNCVLNLSSDKPRVFGEISRVLRPGGRFAVSDVISDDDMDEQTRADMAEWTGCIAGALTKADFESELTAAGLEGIEFREMHRVHRSASSAIVRARKPATGNGSAGCRAP
jgi:ubiquinone/menaquinone biosynthesis C-methylase UbiE